MNILEATFMGVGLAMDALAVSLTLGAVGWSCPKLGTPSPTGSAEPVPAKTSCNSPAPEAASLPPVCSLCRPRTACSCGCADAPASGHTLFSWDKIVLTAALFGAFQAMMPALGWFGSGLCGDIVRDLGKYAAGILLALVAAQMLWEGFSKKEDAPEKAVCSLFRLIVLAFATSIDAFLVGVSYTFLGRTGRDIAGDVLIIGAVTAAISAAGCVCGRMFGNRLGNRSSVLGGLVLLGIAAKITFFG